MTNGKTEAAEMANQGILHTITDGYAKSAPNTQDTVDIFKGTWNCLAPVEAMTGPLNLLDDPRINLAHKKFNFSSKSVLELGPLEASHTHQMHRLGAASVLGVEGNARSFLKCLLVKEEANLHRARFLYGDIVEYLEETLDQFDVIVASGVLYHMTEPLRLLSLIKKHTDRAFIWTGFYQRDVMASAYGESFAARFGDGVEIERDGYKCLAYPQYYQDAVNNPDFSGGSLAYSLWLTKEDIIGYLNHIGFKNVEAHDVDTSYGFAPRLSIIAEAKASGAL